MPQNDIKTKAAMLLKRRDTPNSPWYYFYADRRRQLLFLVLSIVNPLIVWSAGFDTLALVFASFIVGVKVRDVRWWFALSKLWPDTEPFLDWDKINAIANGDPES